MPRVVFLFVYAVVSAASLAAPTTQPLSDKKLIEFGWDEPDTAFMRAHVAEMERTPFDGCVFHIRYTKAGGTLGDFLWENWGTRAFDESEFKAAIDDLKNTPFKHFTENFLRFNVSPGDVDWFDDFSAIVTNAKLAAKIARDGHCRGILFDIEQYNHALFNYRKQKDAGSKSWDQYAAQARSRGKEVMAAFQAGYPDLTILLTFGYTLPLAQCNGDPAKLPDADYGLLAPFLDGMLDAGAGNTHIIDGYEFSYSYKDITRFDPAYATIKTGALKICSNPGNYNHFVSAAFGVWLDNDWRKKGWNEADLQKNFYTPSDFQSTVRKALETSDQYVWIYAEQPRWWTARGTSEKLPQAYEQAVRDAVGR